MARNDKRWETPPGTVIAAALVQGLIAAALAAVVIWLVGRGPERALEAPWDTFLIACIAVGAMAGAVWSRRPGQRRQGIFR